MCDSEHTHQSHRRHSGLVVPAMQPSSGGFLMINDATVVMLANEIRHMREVLEDIHYVLDQRM